MMTILKPVLLIGAVLLTASQGAAPDTITGTVRSVDLRNGTVEMITGRGLALRTYDVHVDRNTTVRMEGRAAAVLADLKPGQVVRIRYTLSTEIMVASAIDVVWAAGP